MNFFFKLCKLPILCKDFIYIRKYLINIIMGGKIVIFAS